MLKFFKNSLLMVSVWLLSFFAAELAFRCLGDHPSADMKNLFAAFGDHSYRLARNVQTGAKWASGPFTVSTDALGLRCDVRGQSRTVPGQHLDYLFLGDSQGFGNGVEFEDTIAGFVAGEAAGKGLSCGNASVGGHGALNQIEVAQFLRNEEKLKTKRYVILMTPGMIMYGDGYTRATVGPDGKLYDRPKTQLEQSIIFLKQSSVAYLRLRDATRSLGIGTTPTADAPFILQVFSAHLRESAAKANLKAFLLKMIEFAKMDEAEVILVYVPLTVEADFEKVRLVAEPRGLTVDENLPWNTCNSVAKELGLPALDLRPQLHEQFKTGSPLNLKGDYHYNSGLSKTCGKAVWNFLDALVKKS